MGISSRPSSGRALDDAPGGRSALSTDDISFEDVQYREPKRARRPDRDRRWACVAYEVPGAEDLPIFLDRRPADAIERHALRDTSVELGGILLGRECVDDQTGQPFVWVTEAIEAKHYENTQASFTYTHDSWEEITRERDRRHPDLDIVGWYHTHPDFGIFLSSHDLFIHRNFFAQPLQLAYVVDPVRQTRGFFRWRDGGLDQVGGYFLSAERGDRLALARLANDLESLPNAEPGGGGLSPRLEAELIAMLSRPHQAPTSAADRAQVATLFGTLGLLVGIVLVAAVAWLYSLTQQLRDQTEVLADLRKSAEQSDKVQQVALDALLARESPGADPKRFLDSLTRAQKELGVAKDEAKSERALALVAAAENRRLVAVLDQARKAEAEAAEKAALTKDEVEKQRQKIKELDGVLDQYYKSEKGEVERKYQYSWYFAVAGWLLAILATLATLALWAARTPEPGEDPRGIGPAPGGGMGGLGGVAPGPPPPGQEPPHQIL